MNFSGTGAAKPLKKNKLAGKDHAACLHPVPEKSGDITPRTFSFPGLS